MTSDPIPDVTAPQWAGPFPPLDHVFNFWMQLASISYATQALLLGHVTLNERNGLLAGQPSFLDINAHQHQVDYSWGDVSKGIEELSHNVTAALLKLSLGTLNTTCSFDNSVVAYQYIPFDLWVPYGVSIFSLLSSHNLTFSPLCFTDGIMHCSNRTHCCCHDNGEK
jgi:hypothetical protein